MCGIVGFSGTGDVVSVLLDGLSRLEYRGYDSAGLACLDSGKIWCVRRTGKVAELERAVRSAPLPAGAWASTGNGPAASVGIAHTRWATHGSPTERNAHPHLDCTGRIAVIHNGILDNYRSLRRRLEDQGHSIASDTDSELLAHLLEEGLASGKSLHEAARHAMSEAEGAIAMAAIAAEYPDCVVVARRDSPLLVGKEETFSIAASDIPALLPYTRNVVVLEDGEVAVLKGPKVELYDSEGNRTSPRFRKISWEAESPELGRFPDFMLKEIYEQPEAVARTLMSRVDAGNIVLDDVRIDPADLASISKVCAVACGTSYHAALASKYSTERWARIAVEVDLSSEFRYRDPVIDDRVLLVAISQSGETADSLAALRHARAQGARVLTICNVVDSSMARESDAVLYTRAGPEIGVAATKTFLAQLTATTLLGLYLGQQRKHLDTSQVAATIAGMQQIPDLLSRHLPRWDEEMSALADRFAETRDVFFLGRGPGYPVALEGALKLKEISYLRAEGYAAGEMKHGPIALIEPGVVVFVIGTASKTQEKVFSNLEEVKARGATTVLVIDSESRALAPESDFVVEVPRVDELLSPMIDVVPLQLFAYYMAKRRGLDVDKPRNLAKTVTVE
jgi:glucosamine--fructose-6-phosphate aminotransferase (isomerizing)